MLTAFTSLFTHKQINTELTQRGMPEAPTQDIAAIVLIQKANPTNLNGWTALYLDTNGGTASNKDLQSLLISAGATSPTAASNRLSMQRNPIKYNVKPEDVARVVPSSSRTGRVKTLTLDLNAGNRKALDTYYAGISQAAK